MTINSRRQLTSLCNSGLGVDLLERSERLQLEKLAEFIQRRKSPFTTLFDAKDFDGLEGNRRVPSAKGSRYCISGGRENFDQVSVLEDPVYSLQFVESPCLGLVFRDMIMEPFAQLLSDHPRLNTGWIWSVSESWKHFGRV